MYDALLKQQVLVVAPVILIIADNPMSSELCNHQGSSARRFCRICLVVKPLSLPTFIHNYITMQVDKAVNPEVIGTLRDKQLSHRQIQRIRRQSTLKGKREMSTLYGLRDSYNPLDRLSLDLYR